MRLCFGRRSPAGGDPIRLGLRLGLALVLFSLCPPSWARRQNFYQIDEHIYAHSTLRAADVERLAKEGFKSIVLFQGGDIETPYLGRLVPFWQKGEREHERQAVREACERYGIQFFNPKINSLKPIREGDPSARAIHEGARLMADDTLWPMVISCGFGIDRCGTVAVTYKVKHKGMGYAEALKDFYKNGHRGVRRWMTISLDRYLDRHVANFAVERGDCRTNLELVPDAKARGGPTSLTLAEPEPAE